MKERNGLTSPSKKEFQIGFQHQRMLKENEAKSYIIWLITESSFDRFSNIDLLLPAPWNPFPLIGVQLGVEPPEGHTSSTEQYNTEVWLFEYFSAQMETERAGWEVSTTGIKHKHQTLGSLG